jgi:hypothetical protein
MTLLRLAGSMLLALGLAALSALSGPPATNHVSSPHQALALELTAPRKGLERALALADVPSPRRVQAAGSSDADAPIIPMAGEFVPEAGQ